MSDLDDDPDARHEILNEINQGELILTTWRRGCWPGCTGWPAGSGRASPAGRAGVVSQPLVIGITTEIRRLFGRCRAASPRNG
jgi:hypothetical protein